MSFIIHGIGVARGIAIGKVHVLRRGAPDVYESCIPRQHIKHEMKRFKKAIKAASQHLSDIRNTIAQKSSKDIAAFIDSHLLMINDEPMKEAIIEMIEKHQYNAEWALELQKKSLLAVFENMDDTYFRSRKSDVEHVIHLIQSFLVSDSEHEQASMRYLKGHIVVADDLTPADTILLHNQGIAGFITELGGSTSHTAILARSLNLPAIVAVHNVCQLSEENETIIMNGDSGMVLCDADTATFKIYRHKQRQEKDYNKQLLKIRNLRPVTQDGVEITLMANIGLPEEAQAAHKINAQGIGLYRTEFLYLDKEDAVCENKQYKTYRSLINIMEGKPITIRTFDLGAEKEFETEQRSPLTTNPALGLRAIRHSLKYPEIFLQQLRAILRATVHGQVRIMFPMLTNTYELEQILQMMELAKTQLRKARKKFSDNYTIGAMIEVPAAALQANYFAKHLDFLSIGTNDLIQYTLAIDRIDDEVNYLYDPLHPSILQLIKTVVQAGKRANIPVAMCGEMASNKRYTKLLLGLGLTEISTQVATLLEVKQAIRDSNVTELLHRCKKLSSMPPQNIAHFVNTL